MNALSNCILPALVLGAFSLQAQNPLVFNGKNARLEIETAGSAISHFSLMANPVNPFSWALLPAQMPPNNQQGPPFKGHFLCTGRWGAPSEDEQKAGMPHNGEVNTRTWTVLQPVQENAGKLMAKTECPEPKDQMVVRREIEFDAKGSQAMPLVSKPGRKPLECSSFRMAETLTNTCDFDRITNFTQHPTLGAPFLEPSTLIDCNAGLGFDQRTHYDSLERSAFCFPNGYLKDGPADLRRVNDDRGYVTTHIFPDGEKIGWVTATNPDRRLLMGYVFKTTEYPWLNLWHWKKDGKPYAHGLEFGTTGLGQPYSLLLQNGVDFFGRKSWDWLGAKKSVTRTYLCFLTEIPEGFDGVKTLKLEDNRLILESGSGKEKLSVPVVNGL